MKYLFAFVFLLSANFAFNQYAQIDIKISKTSDETSYRFCLVNKSDTVHCEYFQYDIKKVIDSLIPGAYTIFIFNKSQQEEPIVRKEYQLNADERTIANISIDISDKVSPYNSESENETHSETQISYGYYRDAWMNQKSAISSNVSFSMTVFSEVPISKHFSFLWGLGLGYSQHNFYKDSVVFNVSEFKEKSEKYSDFTYILDMKFRLFSGTNTIKKMYSQRITLDLGAYYNFPLAFRHNGIYSDNVKISERHIHQLSDVRTYINLGYYPFSVFAEYRPFDFVKGNLPEISKYNFGIKFFIPYY